MKKKNDPVTYSYTYILLSIAVIVLVIMFAINADAIDFRILMN